MLAMHVVAMAAVRDRDIPFEVQMANGCVGTKGSRLLPLKSPFVCLIFHEGAFLAPYSYVDQSCHFLRLHWRRSDDDHNYHLAQWLGASEKRQTARQDLVDLGLMVGVGVLVVETVCRPVLGLCGHR